MDKKISAFNRVERLVKVTKFVRTYVKLRQTVARINENAQKVVGPFVKLRETLGRINENAQKELKKELKKVVKLMKKMCKRKRKVVFSLLEIVVIVFVIDQINRRKRNYKYLLWIIINVYNINQLENGICSKQLKCLISVILFLSIIRFDEVNPSLFS